jgi:hypothetical protein
VSVRLELHRVEHLLASTGPVLRCIVGKAERAERSHDAPSPMR